MSSDRRLAAVVLSVSLAATAHAQTVQELERRIADTRMKYEAAGAALTAYRLSRRPSLDQFSETVTIGRGGVVIRHTPELREQVTAAARRADSLLEYQVGSLIERVRNDTFLVRIDTSVPARNVANIEYRPGGERQGGVRGRMTVQEMADNFVGALGGEIASARKTPLTGWMGGPHVLTELTRSSPTRWPSIRLALVTSPARVARSCYAGNVNDCMIAMQLVKVPDPVTAWYDSAGRFELVKSRKALELRIDPKQTERCQQGSDADCIAVMRRMFEIETERGDAVFTMGAPIDASVRWSLERFALDMGGRGANERMLNDTISVGSGLAAAAGVPLDTVVARWRRTAEEDAGRSSDMSLRIAVTCLAWVGLMLFLALRSPRWR
jgi:hypothetical protein